MLIVRHQRDEWKHIGQSGIVRIGLAMLYKPVSDSRTLVIQNIFQRKTLNFFQSWGFNHEVI